MNMRVYKHIFLTLSLISLFTMSAQSQKPVKDYASAWKKVEAFTEKQLPKSALAEVKKIYALAKKEAQDAQVIKSLIYMSALQAENREDNEVLSIAEIEKEILTAKEPAASLLKSLLAGMYQSYFENNRWQLYDRTKTAKFSKTDIATWDAEDFHKRISELYLQSIKDKKALQQTRLEPYDAVIIKGNMRHLRPTLYDLLAHRALGYFENDERDLQKPAYAFEIDQASAFDPAADFVKRKFTTRDSLSLHHKALLIYQDLIAFHLADAKPDALIDADLGRIAFVKQHSTHPFRDDQYFNALNHLANQYGNLPAAAQAWYLLAAWHEENAATYKPMGDTAYRYSRIKAKEICERLVAQKDSSEGKMNAVNLLQSIRAKSLQFTVEKVNLPGEPFRSLVQYRNFNTLYLRILKADEKLKKALESPNNENYWPTLAAAKAEQSWEQALPATNDMQQHSAEIKIPGLAGGEYILLASTGKDFSAAKNLLGARMFYVSFISYVNSSQDYFVLNRNTGAPLANASVQVWEQKYDYNTSRYTREKGKHFTADGNGYFKLEKTKHDNNNYGNLSYLFEITHDKDRLFMNDFVYDYYYNNEPESEPKTTTSIFLFTDRSIYRPGQTVYFKGIVLARNSGRKSGQVQADYTTTILLRDANYKDADSLVVKTNEYGSFSGKFQLPLSGLNGQFLLYTRDNRGNASIRVEEYKRPKFFVEYEPIKGSYRVNDKIRITGVAKAYAGNNIDGAQVKYRVVRQPRFIYSWMFWRWWQPPVQEMEIAHGELKTDADGKFTVEFTAIPDLKIDKKLEPVFDYTVYADVTDLNGETRSGEQSVSVSYKSLMLVSSIPATLPADSLQKLYIRTENMNGEYEPANVKVTITRLKEEKRLIRERLWDRPDQFTMGREEYIRLFPVDEYDNETDPKTWGKLKEAFSKTDSALQSGDFKVGGVNYEPGYYIIEMETTDRTGAVVKDVKYIELTSDRNRQLTRPAYLWTGLTKTMAEPGENASVEIGTAADNLFVIHQLDRFTSTWPQTGSTFSFLQLNNEKKNFNFPVTPADLGGFGAGWIFVKHNRFHQQILSIQVPWTNKNLKIEYATFRDKTLPGAEEKWKLKISGYKNEKVAAELLASMYDASLDQFAPHAWYQPSIWPNFSHRSFWNTTQNFAPAESSQRYPEEEVTKQVDKRYDYLFNEDGDVTGMVRYDYRGNAMMLKRAMPMAQAEMAGAPADTDRGFATNAVLANYKMTGYAAGVTTENKKDGKDNEGKTGQPTGDVKIRKNFNETAFFLPDLKTDAEGNIEFSFTMPEALTRWKFLALAHTKEAAFGSSTKEIVTQKELMVQPNAPRFLREGDKMEFSAKIVNLAGRELTGIAELQLFDAETGEPVDGRFRSITPKQYFTVAAGQSEAVQFPIEVPYQFNRALQWRIVAKAGDYSDGEENAMPVLTNRMLVTETMPLPMRGTGTKNFRFDKLLKSGSSESLQHQALTVEYTSNPAWYAVQALPYLMEYPYECAEQTWNRYYANSLASYIAGSSPRIRQVFDRWKIKDTAALMSNLQKNQELKAVLLEETPWVLQAKNEAQQKKNIALLFDMVRMSEQLAISFEKLKQMQSSNGGFVWFSGGPDDRYITQYIVTGIGHLQKLNAVAKGQDIHLMSVLSTAIPYLDRKIKEDYDNLLKYKTNLKQNNTGYTQVQYLYMRSFFPKTRLDPSVQTAYNYYYKQVQQYWTGQSKYMQGMIALALHRGGDSKTTAAILKSLKETSITSEEMGMYWKDQFNGWFWYQAPIETQALLIETFREAGNDLSAVDELRTWLLKNKQTNNWKTTKATAEACYALLLQGTEWLSNEPVVEIKLGTSAPVRSTDAEQEAGTGYFKKTIEGAKVMSSMGDISVTVSAPANQTPGKANNGVTWGGVYWQYFEDLDKITPAATPLQLSKKLFVEKNTDRGPVITPVNDGSVIKIGDKIRVRVELRVDRDMEYVHMKDMRASALEPVNVLSSYKWQGGLGYYESTKDASTNFFFSYLRKGTYVFEYTLFATHAGNFSNGVTTIQCMYAPEFSSHSEGVRINVE